MASSSWDIRIEHLRGGYGGTPVLDDLCAILPGGAINVILGASGCGKTTFLRLLAGLLRPAPGTGDNAVLSSPIEAVFSASFVFQEPRLLPWMTALDNVILPIKRRLGKAEAEDRARRFLDLASLGDKARSFPEELSGGERQRVSIARAFAFPAQAIFMDEPFQSLDIPLRLELMDTITTLLETESRFLIAVTHDPREAVYLGKRIIVLGKPPQGIAFDETVSLTRTERAYGAEAHSRLEARLLAVLGGIRQNST